ncbi:sensor histidine kinase [Gloeobacter violaceus]|uniref:histidine kinase n=1 Tax=Gloeobacter violaceus (strain ATCC 29082 / PCC 7421) TaxID=251221 RepID=Q7NIC5_GLOVI|nr:sensor histidine kinase [Gloeobacter violaceus]BAC90199.1 two-component sensor histidine kinase [Gloeobacter violaceus PCC 7421]
MDFSKLLADRSDAIIEQWIAAVRSDRRISSDDGLPYSAVRNSLPDVLRAMVTVLSQTEKSDTGLLVSKSLVHGSLRASQGFNPAEIAQEYRLLRRVIFTVLDGEMTRGSITGVVRAVHLINEVVDEAIASCFQSYVDERLRELAQLQSQLLLTNQELGRLVRAHQDNLSVLAHELKTPLNSIIGYANLFLRTGRTRTDIGDTLPDFEHIERVVRNGTRLLHLINDALEFSRSEAGQTRLHLEAVALRPTVEEVVETIRPLAAAQGLEVSLDCGLAPQTVASDSMRLQQILTNLLSNAVRYTPSGSVRVECKAVDDRHWSVAVSDTGLGIAPEDQPHIFEPYSRFSCNERSRTEGTGLGLAIVSQLVNLLQGKIALVSEPGVGSTFTVTFPVQVQSLTAQNTPI